MLRRQRLVDWLLEASRPGFAAVSTSRKDLLRIAASRVLHGEAVAEVASGMSISAEDAGCLAALPAAERGLQKLSPLERSSWSNTAHYRNLTCISCSAQKTRECAALRSHSWRQVIHAQEK